MITERLRAMGTDIEFRLDAAPGPAADAAITRARWEIARGEALLSRFRPDSELSRLNHDRRLVDPSPELVTVIDLAVAAREATGGPFDPFVHDALVAAGYDRTFDEVSRDGAEHPVGTVQDTAVLTEGDTLRLVGEGSLDLGGIAKGFIVELAAEALSAAGPCLVNAGGDIALRGTPRDGGWTVGVPVPDGEIVVAVPAGAVATSGRDRRRWRRAGRERHHVIDPATGAPAETDILRVTAFAPTAVDAETRATSLFLAGDADTAIAEADRDGHDAVVVTDDGRTLLTRGMAA